ncbi:MAG: hypothetical protein Q8903_14250 [Bacteroidota bacterium]|nr:hypothetical protein [Bacteroidota bacterium]
MACEKQMDFMLTAPIISVFNYLSSLPSIANIKVTFVDRQNYIIHLSNSASFTSWGEDITISFFDPMNGGTRIIVKSKSTVPITLVDYGKNQNNVMSIYQYIASLYNR